MAATESAAGAGDDRDLAVESEICHVGLLVDGTGRRESRGGRRQPNRGRSDVPSAVRRHQNAPVRIRTRYRPVRAGSNSVHRRPNPVAASPAVGDRGGRRRHAVGTVVGIEVPWPTTLAGGTSSAAPVRLPPAGWCLLPLRSVRQRPAELQSQDPTPCRSAKCRPPSSSRCSRSRTRLLPHGPVDARSILRALQANVKGWHRSRAARRSPSRS